MSQATISQDVVAIADLGKQLFKAVASILFGQDQGVMSEEIRSLLADPEGAKKYRNALEELKKDGVNQVTIELPDDNTITLVK